MYPTPTPRHDEDDREERSSNTVRISGLSDADRIHRMAMCSMSSSLLDAPPELSASTMRLSKHSEARSSLASILTQSVRSTAPSLTQMISPAILPVRSSSRMTPKAYTSLFRDGHGLLVLANSGGEYPRAPAFRTCSAMPTGVISL